MERGFIADATEEYQRVMSASEASLRGCAEALRGGRRFEGELQLEESLERAGRFLAQFGGGSSGATMLSNPAASFKLGPNHPFIYYVRGNFVKQSLTRLAMRLRLRGREPRCGCGSLASQTSACLQGCLTSAMCVPRFHVEHLSLLRDVQDLGEAAINLRGLAEDLEICGLPDEGRVEAAGLDEVDVWCKETVWRHQDILRAYGVSFESSW